MVDKITEIKAINQSIRTSLHECERALKYFDDPYVMIENQVQRMLRLTRNIFLVTMREDEDDRSTAAHRAS